MDSIFFMVPVHHKYLHQRYTRIIFVIVIVIVIVNIFSIIIIIVIIIRKESCL